MEVDFRRERAWWDAKASTGERDLGDEAINRALRWREIERHLTRVRSILAVGAGTGVFSIPLARRGFSVTHVDFSPAMLTIARQQAHAVQTFPFVVVPHSLPDPAPPRRPAGGRTLPHPLSRASPAHDGPRTVADTRIAPGDTFPRVLGAVHGLGPP